MPTSAEPPSRRAAEASPVLSGPGVLLDERGLRPAVVERVGRALASGTYDPPADAVAERILAALCRNRTLCGR